jgi:ribosomal protein S3AE
MTIQDEFIPTLGRVLILTHPRANGLCEICAQDHSIAKVKAVAISKKRLQQSTLADLFWRGEE